MSTYQHDDHKFAIFFTVVGFLGLPGALMGLYVFSSGMWPFGEPGTYTRSVVGTNVPAVVGLALIVASGIWLLRQYFQRARRKPADVADVTLWKLSSVHNGCLLFGALALFTYAEVVFVSAFVGCMALWAGFLFLLSTIAAVRAKY